MGMLHVEYPRRLSKRFYFENACVECFTCFKNEKDVMNHGSILMVPIRAKYFKEPCHGLVGGETCTFILDFKIAGNMHLIHQSI